MLHPVSRNPRIQLLSLPFYLLRHAISFSRSSFLSVLFLSFALVSAAPPAVRFVSVLRPRLVVGRAVEGAEEEGEGVVIAAANSHVELATVRSKSDFDMERTIVRSLIVGVCRLLGVTIHMTSFAA